MRLLALALYLGFPLAALAHVPSATPKLKPIRVSLINLSGQRRQALTESGRVLLPVGVRVDINTHVGCSLHIVSDMDSKVDTHLCTPPAAERALLVVR